MENLYKGIGHLLFVLSKYLAGNPRVDIATLQSGDLYRAIHPPDPYPGIRGSPKGDRLRTRDPCCLVAPYDMCIGAGNGIRRAQRIATRVHDRTLGNDTRVRNTYLCASTRVLRYTIYSDQRSSKARRDGLFRFTLEPQGSPGSYSPQGHERHGCQRSDVFRGSCGGRVLARGGFRGFSKRNFLPGRGDLAGIGLSAGWFS